MPVVRRLFVLLVVASTLVGACADDDDTGAAQHADGGADTTTTTARSNGCGSSSVVAGTERLEVGHDGTTRQVERVIPPAYDGQEPLPLIVSLHGFTSTIEQQDLFSGLPEMAAERGYVLLTPQGADATLPVGGQEITAPFWNIRPDETTGVDGAQDDVGFLTELIDSTVEDLCIDADRVYVTGNSNGAGMASVLACAMPGRLAAIAPVSGINLASPCPELEPVSVVAFHGDADPLVPYEGEQAAGVDLGNPPVEDAVASFASAARCSEAPSREALFDDVQLQRWPDCRPGFDVELYTVVGGGHTWPGMLNYIDAARLRELAEGMDLPAAAGVDVAAIAGHMTLNVEATTAMLDFFDAHPRAGG